MSPARLQCAGSLPVLSLILGLLTGCGRERSGSESAGAVFNPGRGALEAIPLPDGDTAGSDPITLARALYGEAAWMGPRKEVYARTAGVKADIVAELRGIADRDAQLSVPMVLACFPAMRPTTGDFGGIVLTGSRTRPA